MVYRHTTRCWGSKQVIAPWRQDNMPPADCSSTHSGSTSVCRWVRSLRISGVRPAAGSQRAYSPGWDRQTDRSRYRLMPPYGMGINDNTDRQTVTVKPPKWLYIIVQCWFMSMSYISILFNWEQICHILPVSKAKKNSWNITFFN